MPNSLAEQQSNFTFQSVLFKSDRSEIFIELRESTLDLIINEHIEKPYLTGIIQIKDDESFLSQADILGAETIEITLKSNRENTKAITKTFYIDKILNAAKTNDSSEMLILHLIEDIGYIANLINVNRAYEGKPSDIISKILRNFLNKEIDIAGSELQRFNLIVPNLNPLEAVSWIKNRASTVDGYPFFLYSTLVGDNLKFSDLGSLLTNNVMNQDVPYRYYQAASISQDPDVQRRVITYYSQEMVEDLFTLIQKGLVGAQYQYLDTIKNNKNKFDFDIAKDLLKPLIEKNVLGKNKNPLYSPDYNLNGISFNELKTRSITQIGGSSAFTNQSYSESIQLSDYKLNVISRAMINILRKAPMEIVVNGIDFIDGDYNATIGNNLRVEFLKTIPENNTDNHIDSKKSGDYLIYATEHQFKREKYDIKLSLVKLGNYSNAHSR